MLFNETGSAKPLFFFLIVLLAKGGPPPQKKNHYTIFTYLHLKKKIFLNAFTFSIRARQTELKTLWARIWSAGLSLETLALNSLSDQDDFKSIAFYS